MQQLVSSVQDVSLNHTAALSHEFTCVDVCNTGRLTLAMLTELMQRYSYSISCQAIQMPMTLVYKLLLRLIQKEKTSGLPLREP